MSMMLLNETVTFQGMDFLDLYKTNSYHLGIVSTMVESKNKCNCASNYYVNQV